MKHNTPKEYKHTSIMHEIKSDKFVPEINLLFTDYGDFSNKLVQKTARHDFWQMEFILEGNALVCFDKSKITLSEKQILIIPPGVKHHFVYSGQHKTWSFKFNLYPELPEDLQILLLPRENDNAQNLYNVLFQLLAEYKQIPASLYDTFEYLIGGVIVMNYAKNEDEDKIPEWAIAAKEFIAVNIEENINLEDLATHLNYTRIHLSRLCKTHLNMKLKDFFDQEKANIIKKKLIYSQKSITEIAKETGFNDVYSFSRFYKRVTTLTPSEQRKFSEGNQ
jgi:AraC-like DNA-binding protein/mannose-6-phosphate isomerase-like protein (cupin superfamily)